MENKKFALSEFFILIVTSNYYPAKRIVTTQVIIAYANHITTRPRIAWKITVLPFFTFSSSQAAVRIVKPPHIAYITAISVRNDVNVLMRFPIAISIVPAPPSNGAAFSGPKSNAALAILAWLAATKLATR